MMFYHVAIHSVKFTLNVLVYYRNTLFLRWLLWLKNQLLSLSHILSPNEHTLDGMSLVKPFQPEAID